MTEICGGADGGDFRISDYGFGGIGYAAGEGGICGLGMKNRGTRNEEENEQGGKSVHVPYWIVGQKALSSIKTLQ